MANLTSNFDDLADMELWLDAGVLFVAFLAPTLLKNTIEGRVGVDAPDEVYGILVIILAEWGLDDYKRPAEFGGALYTVDALATRLGVKSEMQNLASQGV